MSRILIFSQRNSSRALPFRCAHFEFEDVICEVDSVSLVTPKFNPGSKSHSRAKLLAYHTPLVLNPGIEAEPLSSDYEVFLMICGDPTDLLLLKAIPNWRNRCRYAVCLIDEVWVTQMQRYANFLRLLEKFDRVILYYSQSIEPLNRRIGARCVYLPPAVDTLRFCPWPNPPQRSIDVYSVGRRSAVTHHSLLQMAAQQGKFYVYDSTTADQVLNQHEHRELYANLVKRSRYYIVNPGLIDRRDVRGDQIEIGNRYFEGAAAGAVMIGERPDNGQFEKFFDWPDPMIHLPWNSSEMPEIVRQLDQDPARLKEMGRRNVEQCLLRHDWVYRWEAVLRELGMDLQPQGQNRKARLRDLAQTVTDSSSGQSSDLVCADR